MNNNTVAEDAITTVIDRNGDTSRAVILGDSMVDSSGSVIGRLSQDGDTGNMHVDYITGHKGYLVKDMYAHRYALADGEKRLPVNNYDFCMIVKCDLLKYVCFIIPKNGCSCILASALKYDYGISTPGKHVWGVSVQNCVVPSAVASALFSQGRYDGYKKFIVVQDEYERFIRFINWTHKAKYNKFLDLSLTKHDSFMEHLALYPYMSRDMQSGDEHSVPQNLYIDTAVARMYAGNRTMWDADVERVMLSDLKGWFENTFNAPMVMNNIDRPKDELFKLEDLTEEERSALENTVCQLR